jgi:hypothetical protein
MIIVASSHVAVWRLAPADPGSVDSKAEMTQFGPRSMEVGADPSIPVERVSAAATVGLIAATIIRLREVATALNIEPGGACCRAGVAADLVEISSCRNGNPNAMSSRMIAEKNSQP